MAAEQEEDILQTLRTYISERVLELPLPLALLALLVEARVPSYIVPAVMDQEMCVSESP